MRRPLAFAAVGAFAALAVIAVLGTGCYSPKISEGDFKCTPADTGLCPSGFSCGHDGRCYRALPMFDLSMGPFVGSGALGDLDLSTMAGTLLLDAATGEVTFTDAASATTTLVPAMANGFAAAAQPAGPMVAMWSFKNLRIGPQVTVKPTGTVQSFSFAVALAATETLEMRGTLYYNGAGGRGGSGTRPAESAVPAGAGKAAADDNNGAGGGGGGYGSDGVAGAGPATSSGAPGTVFGTPELKPVHLGAGGGRGGAVGGTGAGPGGSGGGALALFGTRVIIAGTIDVGGAKPPAATAAMAGGGGGGAGGSLLISGDTLTLEGPNAAMGTTGHKLLAAGGSGGAAGTGGMAGGSGGNGRIWLGANSYTIAGGTLVSTPTAVQATAPVLVFPR